MERGFSIYLDAVRFLAAVLVYLWHSNQRAIIEPVVPFSGYGHSAVIVFFVLSGFVIAHVTDTKENRWPTYTASRVSRIWSVALPAVLLTPLLDAAGRALQPALYAFPWDHFALRMIASLAMLNEPWFVSITMFSNAPYWSVTYEVWYYVMFGLATFVPSPWRWPMVAAVLLALGPKIALLAPVWAAGVLLYRWRWPLRWSPALSWALAVLSLAGIVALHLGGVLTASDRWFRALAGEALTRDLAYSKFFFGDWLLGVLVFSHFAAVRNVAPVLLPLLARVEKPVRLLAGYTFTLYLLHQPVLLFWAAVVRGDPRVWWGWTLVTLLTAASVWAIGVVTEQRRQGLRRWLQTLLERLSAAGRQLPQRR